MEMRGWHSREEKAQCRYTSPPLLFIPNLVPKSSRQVVNPSVKFQLPSSLSADTSSKLFISKINLGICLAPHAPFLSLHLCLGDVKLLRLQSDLQNGLSLAHCRSLSSWALFLFQPTYILCSLGLLVLLLFPEKLLQRPLEYVLWESRKI